MRMLYFDTVCTTETKFIRFILHVLDVVRALKYYLSIQSFLIIFSQESRCYLSILLEMCPGIDFVGNPNIGIPAENPGIPTGLPVPGHISISLYILLLKSKNPIKKEFQPTSIPSRSRAFAFCLLPLITPNNFWLSCLVFTTPEGYKSIYIMEATTTTLADALLDDLDDLMDSDNEDQEENHQQEQHHQFAASSNHDTSLVVTTAVGFSDKPPDDALGDHHHHHNHRLRRLVFLESPALLKHLKRLRNHRLITNDEMKVSSSNTFKDVEEENHQLVVQCNKFLVSLREEMGIAHGELAQLYKPKFPELEELIPNFIQYKNAVRIIGNEMDLTKVNDELNEILGSNQIITISIAGSTTSGRPLSSDEWNAVEAAAAYMDQLLDIQNELVTFVENSMESLCPSICALIGPSTAAKLLGLAGGLAELTKIPSCNLQVMGQTKQTAASRAGLSGLSLHQQNVGVLGEADLIQSLSKQYHKKALKVVAGKLALAARYDFVNVDTGRPRSASTGLKLRQELQEKFEKWQEPDKAPVLKALPKPDLEVKKRRGGKRSRRWKERFEETTMMKQANTRAFSAQQGEYGDDAMGITMGLLDTADNGGAIRRVSQKRKMRQTNTKTSRKRAIQIAQAATKHKDGLASSVVFTQTTGMELVNPEARKERVKAANAKWFKDNAGFQSAALPRT
jgi:U4/U6 small nuclear ribonucleoprotein PRP31